MTPLTTSSTAPSSGRPVRAPSNVAPAVASIASAPARPKTRLRREPAPVNARRAEPDQPPLVVIVDDDAGICYAFESYFVERGWQVRAVASGEQGLELLDDLRLLGQPVDLVLLDISLPGIDGVQAVQLYRKLVKLNARVIAMSAYHSPTLLSELRPHGVDIFIEKPVDLSHFDNVLASLPR